MRLALLASLTAAALLTPLAACGGDDGDSTITDPGTWLETYITKLCTKAHACKADYVPSGSETFEDAWGADVTACKATFITAAQVRASVTAGKATFNADAGKQCLAMLPYDGQTCPDFWATSDPAVCGTVFMGTVAASGACANGLECQSGLFCVQGVCTAPNADAPRSGVGRLNTAVFEGR